MDLNTARSIVTVVAFVMFIGLIFWAYSARRKDAFAEAANLPFADNEAEDLETQSGSAEVKGLRQ